MRTPLSKRVRFEVFKRDKFVCQYCGRSAPDVVLEVDHIVPVSKGGDNSMLNLITSCRDCNRGKSNVELSDDAAVKKQKQQLDELADRREQTEMLIEWRKELMNIMLTEIEAVQDVFRAFTDFEANEAGCGEIRRLIERFGLDEVMTATEMAIARYYYGTEKSWANAFSKIGGICYNRKKARENDAQQNN